MEYLQNKHIGIVKFFDKKKNFGFIYTYPKCIHLNRLEYNNSPKIYDFYCNSDSFVNNAPLPEGEVVIFDGDGTKAYNVDCFVLKEEFFQLAFCYYHTRLYNYIKLPRIVSLNLLQILIETNKNYSASIHFRYFVGLYKKDNLSDDKYIYDRDYKKTDLKGKWSKIINIIPENDLFDLMTEYPSLYKYINDKNILERYIKNKLEDCKYHDINSIKLLLDHLNFDCQEEIQDLYQHAIDSVIITMIEELKLLGSQNYKSRFIERTVNDNTLNRKKNNLNKLVEQSNKDYSKELDDVNFYILYGPYETIINELKNSPLEEENYVVFKRIDNVFYHDELEKILCFVIENICSKVDLYAANELLGFLPENKAIYFSHQFLKALIENYIKRLNNTEDLFSQYDTDKGLITTILTADDYKEFVRTIVVLLSKIDDFLCLNFLTDCENDLIIGCKDIINEIINRWTLSFIKDKLEDIKNVVFKNAISDIFICHTIDLFDKDGMVSYLSSMDSVYVIDIIYLLSDLCDGRKHKDEIKIMQLKSQLLPLLSLDDIIHNFDQLKHIYSDELEEFVNKIVDLIGNKTIEDAFISSFGDNPKIANLNFLKNLKMLCEKKENSKLNYYLSSRSHSDMIILFDNQLTNVPPLSYIQNIIDSISLEHVEVQDVRKWEQVPKIKDCELLNKLKRIHVDLFDFIRKRIDALSKNIDNLGLLIFLCELLKESRSYHNNIISEKEFNSKLLELGNSYKEDLFFSTVLWSVSTLTPSKKKGITNYFYILPPYLQKQVLNLLFYFVSIGSLKLDAEGLYGYIGGGKNPLLISIDIVFKFLIFKQKNPDKYFDNSLFIDFLLKRKDHANWKRVVEFMIECEGRNVYTENDKTKKTPSYKGGLSIRDEDKKIRFLLLANIVKNKTQQEPNPDYYAIQDYIKTIIPEGNYKKTILSHNNIEYIFDPQYISEIKAMMYKYDIIDRLDISKFITKKFSPNKFCECRLANKVDTNSGFPFFWCNNLVCINKPLSFNIDWQNYKIYDYMRILGIPIDYIDKQGKKTRFGNFSMLSSFFELFREMYTHLKCRKCGELMYPNTLGNFGYRVVNEFSCMNQNCVNNGITVYLNHCFNKPKCKTIIDSRDSRQCSNNQFICQNCGACCSTLNYQNRIQNLKKTGGSISQWILNFVQNNMGHWEKGIRYCHLCGVKLENDKCPACGHSIKT